MDREKELYIPPERAMGSLVDTRLDSIPTIKIDPINFQIYFEFSYEDLYLPDYFQSKFVYKFDKGARIFLNQVEDFRDSYSGKKLNGEVWDIGGISLDEKSLYFNKSNYKLVQDEEMEAGTYITIEKNSRAYEFSGSTKLASFLIGNREYIIYARYVDDEEIKLLKNRQSENTIGPIVIKDKNLKRAWEEYYNNNYYDSINYLSLAEDYDEGEDLNYKTFLRFSIYLKTLRITTLREELKLIKDSGFLFDAYKIFDVYSSIFNNELTEGNSISDSFMGSFPLLKEDKKLYKNLVDILNNHNKLDYLLKYKDTENPIETLLLYKLFFETGNNLFKEKLIDIKSKFPSSLELKEILKDMEMI